MLGRSGQSTLFSETNLDCTAIAESDIPIGIPQPDKIAGDVLMIPILVFCRVLRPAHFSESLFQGCDRKTCN